MFTLSRKRYLLSVLFIGMGTMCAVAADQDQDGVDDLLDACCDTPAGIPVDADGRPLGDIDLDCDVDLMDVTILWESFTGPIACSDQCTLTCGIGACQVTLPPCTNGEPNTCTPNPPQTESCNGIDDDCNGIIDDENAQGCTLYYPPDNDGDGFGSCGQGRCLCAPGGNYMTTQGDDCDDADPNLYPGSTLPCRACNNQCMPVNLNAGNASCGIGACRVTAPNCINGQPNPCTPNPASPEVCDGIDNDCDALIDELWDFLHDVNNCGHCGTVCPPRLHATPVCNNGTCGFTCNSGYGNCNQNSTDGCETNLLTDEYNCGTCSHVCNPLFFLCLNGQCP